MASLQGQVLERARQDFLAHGVRPPATVVRRHILESWRRSALHGLNPHSARPAVMTYSDHDTQLTRAARSLVESRGELLSALECGITLTDSSGCVLDRWVRSRQFEQRLDARGVVPGNSLAESEIGTSSSGIALETGQSVLVVGAEHFADGAIRMTTAGAPIRHPGTRQVLGTLNLTCWYSDTTPLMLSWIREIAMRIEDRILHTVSSQERALLDTYLRGTKDTRHPVICMNDTSIIGNAAATKLLGDLDQSVVWEAASRTVQSGTDRTFDLITTSGNAEIGVTCKPIKDGGETFGAEIRLTRRPVPAHSHSADIDTDRSTSAGLTGMVGRSAAWQTFCAQVQRVPAGEPLLLTGEPGTGKTSVLAALAPSAPILDAQRVLADGKDWLGTVRTVLAAGHEVVVLDSTQALDENAWAATMRLLEERGPSCRVLAARTISAASELNPAIDNGVTQWPGVVTKVPPLRDRLGDIPLLLQEMTAARTASSFAPVWTQEAVHTLTRVQWIANVTSLERVIGAVLRRPAIRYVHNSDLPPSVVSMATRRQLFGLDLLEAHAITSALAAAEGNKKLAADYLGIARSTLYRKVRALGISLNGVVY